MTPLTLDDFPLERPVALSPLYNGAELVILQWLRQLVSPNEGGVVQWVSIHHLLIDFQQTTNIVGFRKVVQLNSWQQITHWEAAQDYSFSDVVRSFSTMVRNICSLAGVAWESYPRRPSGGAFRRWVRCIRLRASMSRIQAIDQLLAHHKVVPIHHVGKAMAALPPFVRGHIPWPDKMVRSCLTSASEPPRLVEKGIPPKSLIIQV